jgi:hypothetical protein
MIPVQIHLAIVHVPILGMAFATLLLLLSRFRQRMDWTRFAYGLFIITALGAVIAFFSGHGSEEATEHVLNLSRHRVHEHEEAATFCLVLALGAGALAVLLLAMEARLSHTLRRNLGRLLLVLGLVGSAALAVAAHRGGEIRHPEISGDSPSVLVPPADDKGEEP